MPGKLKSPHQGSMSLPHHVLQYPQWFNGIDFIGSLNIGGPGSGISFGNYPMINTLMNFFDSVTGVFSVKHTQLENLQGCPQKIMGSFNCENNSKLTSLQGAPADVGWTVDIVDCPITDLRGLEDTQITGHLFVHKCPLTSVDGFPHKVPVSLYVDGKLEIYQMFKRAVGDNSKIHILNERGEDFPMYGKDDVQHERTFNWDSFWEDGIHEW